MIGTKFTLLYCLSINLNERMCFRFTAGNELNAFLAFQRLAPYRLSADDVQHHHMHWPTESAPCGRQVKLVYVVSCSF